MIVLIGEIVFVAESAIVTTWMELPTDTSVTLNVSSNDRSLFGEELQSDVFELRFDPPDSRDMVDLFEIDIDVFLTSARRLLQANISNQLGTQFKHESDTSWIRLNNFENTTKMSMFQIRADNIGEPLWKFALLSNQMWSNVDGGDIAVPHKNTVSEFLDTEMYLWQSRVAQNQLPPGTKTSIVEADPEKISAPSTLQVFIGKPVKFEADGVDISLIEDIYLTKELTTGTNRRLLNTPREKIGTCAVCVPI
jgi:hypothetical protein